jgi:hypothetical protein
VQRAKIRDRGAGETVLSREFDPPGFTRPTSFSRRSRRARLAVVPWERTMKLAALYARVSSDRQKADKTIASQTADAMQRGRRSAARRRSQGALMASVVSSWLETDLSLERWLPSTLHRI